MSLLVDLEVYGRSQEKYQSARPCTLQKCSFTHNHYSSGEILLQNAVHKLVDTLTSKSGSKSKMINK